MCRIKLDDNRVQECNRKGRSARPNHTGRLNERRKGSGLFARGPESYAGANSLVGAGSTRLVR